MLTIRTQFIFPFLFLSLLSACGSDSESSTVKVYKHDGRIQCEESPDTLTQMRLELARAGIDVICAQIGSPGYSAPAVCGAASATINVYTIHKSNLPDAEKLGFYSVIELPEYKDQVCTN